MSRAGDALLKAATWRARHYRLLKRASIAISLMILMGVGLFAAYMAPSHPVSRASAPSVEVVEWIWSGGLTDDSIIIRARLARDSDAVFLLVSTSDDLDDPRRYGPEVAYQRENLRVVTFKVQGLEADTRYHYTVEAGGRVERNRQGSFRTPAGGPYSFSFAVASCATTGSNGQVFDAIRQLNPLFFMNIGDLHYENIRLNLPQRFREAYTTVLTSPAQSALYRSTAFAYVWDDHDYGVNDSDRTSPSREAAQRVYREWVPTHPLAIEGDVGPIYRAFTIGRVRFIVTDQRSQKSPPADPDTAEKTMFGEEQKVWLKRELLAARDAYPLTIWVQGVPWIIEPAEGSDSWGGYTTERREIANFIADNDIQGLLMISGDAHMLAIDDGTHSDYSTSGGEGFPVLQAAPLDRPGNVKGGPYSEGTISESGQFGFVTVEDRGDTMEVTLSGRNYERDVVMRYTFTVPVVSGE